MGKEMKKLIILYGPWSQEYNGKQQMMINGNCTCMYRSYAKEFGEIIYLSPQNVSLSWEKSIYESSRLLEYINSQPDSIVWVVKHDPERDKRIIKFIKNKKLYYSCNAHNCRNDYCDISLVDTEERQKKHGGNSKVWFKGKDPEFWKPSPEEKIYDYLLIGRRADKNELYFLDRLNAIDENRKILWIGGAKHKSQINTKHDVTTTDFAGPNIVSQNISKAKVGILMTEHPSEGFPQSFLEMTMSGLPVLYTDTAPRNDRYFKEGINCLFSSKKEMVLNAEKLLLNHNPEECRKWAIEHYSLESSYKNMLSLL